MFRFANPEYLYFLIAVPIVVLLFCWSLYARRKKLRTIGDIELLKGLMPDVSIRWRIWKFIFLTMALSCLILALARPQMGMNISTQEHTGIEVAVTLDVSNSMLATDVSPNRLAKAKELVSNMADKMTDDKISLVVFAGQAFIQLPITSDIVSARMFLDAISPSMISAQGTNLGEALRLSMGSFSAQRNVQRAIVVITDGEDQAEDAEKIAAEAAGKGMHVFVLGIGSAKGSTIPAANGDYFRDREGKVVVTKLNEEMCQKIATSGKGTYIHVDNSNIAQERLSYELNKLQKSALGSTVYSDYAEQFQLFILMSLLFMLIDVLLLERKGHFFSSLLRQLKGKKANVMVLLFCCVVTGYAQRQDQLLVRKGNKAYAEKRYAEAETFYRKALEQNSQNSRALYNLGNALLFQQKPKEAMTEYEKASHLEKNVKVKSSIYHNMGVILQSQKQFGQAAECYKESLRHNPLDNGTRYNLALCQHQMKYQQDKEKDHDEKDDEQKQNKKENQQSDSQQNQQKQNRGQKNEMSKDNADQLLRAAQMKENQTQDKVRKSQMQANRKQMERNW